MPWYHGSSSIYEASIKESGLCPPNKCPVEVEQHGACREDTVYLTKKFEVAQHIGWVKAAGTEPKKANVYKILKLAKKCKIDIDDFDPKDFKSFRIHGCGCVKPSFRCEITNRLSTEKQCKWEKV